MQGFLTDVGLACFESVRAQLAFDEGGRSISDGDVIEHAVRLHERMAERPKAQRKA